MAETRWIDAKEIAVLIRRDLRESFPGVKFSVRARRFAGGSSVDVRWTDGPLTFDVDPMANRYAGKSFDGMDDSTHYHDVTLESGEIVRAGSWISTARHESPEVVARMRHVFERVTGYPIERFEFTCNRDSYLWRLARRFDPRSATFDARRWTTDPPERIAETETDVRTLLPLWDALGGPEIQRDVNACRAADKLVVLS